jgi:uncharacterized cupin superfamily protein
MIEDWMQEAAASLPLEMSDVPPAQVVAGRPQTGAKGLGRFGGVNLGVWEMSPGTMRDTEVEEIFVVLTGAATVDFETRASISLKPGDVVRLHAGERTVWTVTQALRKVYLSLPIG